jgi:hypothetical protein
LTKLLTQPSPYLAPQSAVKTAALYLSGALFISSVVILVGILATAQIVVTETFCSFSQFLEATPEQ